MKILITYCFFVLLGVSGLSSYAQSSNFNTNGDWSISGNWDNGVPTSTTNATIEGNDCTVSSNAECNNLSLWSGSILTIDSQKILKIEGDLDFEENVQINNSGSLQIKGNLLSFGSVKVTVGGRLELAGGIQLEESIQGGE